jgi:hypothetical protein
MVFVLGVAPDPARKTDAGNRGGSTESHIRLVKKWDKFYRYVNFMRTGTSSSTGVWCAKKGCFPVVLGTKY